MGIGAIVDTNIISYTFKRDSRHLRYQKHLDNHILAISFMTIAELDLWAASRGWGARKQAELEAFLAPYTVVESSRELCRIWGDICNDARRNGRVTEPSDAWIASTALLYEVPLITHNAKDFDWITRLTVISEPDK